MSDDNSDKPNLKHLAWAGGIGAALGALWHSNKIAEAKKSRAERDNPIWVEEVQREIDSILDQWEPDEECETEADFAQHLFNYLDANSQYEIELYPSSPEGTPDILIGDALALELKINPGKSERDRCVGQCAGYSRLWATWIVLVDAKSSRVGRLEQLLADKGLENIAVWNFPL